MDIGYLFNDMNKYTRQVLKRPAGTTALQVHTFDKCERRQLQTVQNSAEGSVACNIRTRYFGGARGGSDLFE
jgi:hypothetical protein